mgnify:CR=1 FL=1
MPYVSFAVTVNVIGAAPPTSAAGKLVVSVAAVPAVTVMLDVLIVNTGEFTESVIIMMRVPAVLSVALNVNMPPLKVVGENDANGSLGDAAIVTLLLYVARLP